jgi:hypothetical protein
MQKDWRTVTKKKLGSCYRIVQSMAIGIFMIALTKRHCRGMAVFFPILSTKGVLEVLVSPPNRSAVLCIL